jgi:two-component system phosphate regulon sensor histidine kinase PhoR
VHYEGNDEIAVLSRNLNEMREALSAHIDRLQKNSDRLAIVLGTMSEGVVALDNRKHILFANSAARVLLDFATPDPVGRPLLEAVRNRTVQQAVESAFSTDEPTTLEVELSSTVRRIVSIQARRLPGTPSPGVLVVLHDVSDLRRLENLRQEFVANVSHELKTPLTIIKAFAETLLDGAISDQEHNVSFVRQISEQAERLHQLILDLLSVARIESGDERFELDAIPIHGLITACVQRYKPAADVKEVQLTANSSDDGLQVMADEEAIREILDNLIDNAIKYTPSGGNVTIECRSQQSMVQIDVSDTGIGIPADLQNRIFERFYRVDKARSRELGGTGLGLSIVKHLVAAMGGTVAVRSELNRGSTFTVCLPRA